MFGSPHSYDPSFIEATVTSVDPKRFICSVKTMNGKFFSEVKWLSPTGGYTEGGMYTMPAIQDRVLISTSLGYPLILGCIPRVGSPSETPHSLTGAASLADPGTDSTLRSGITANPGKPIDYLPNDFVYEAKGGATIAVLASGAAILKASPLSQIILSRFEGLLRLVTRNYQRFSDASSNVSANMKGRLYEWFGADPDITKNRTSQERYQELYGDVAAGEALLGNPDPSIAMPVADSRIRQRWLKDSSGAIIMTETLGLNGDTELRVTNNSGNTVSIITKVDSTVISVNGPGGTSTIECTPNALSLNNGGHSVMITSSGINLS